MSALRLSRRKLVLGAGLAAVGGAADAFGLEPRWVEISEHTVHVPRLPHALDGFRIAQLTDVHLGQIGVLHEAIAGAIQRLDPGLVVLTGDLVNGPSALDTLTDFCAMLRGARRAMLSTLGNWEHWGRTPIDALRRAYARAGATLLINDATVVGSGLTVVATDDATAGNVNLAAALSRAAPAPVRLFLTHSPSLLDSVPRQSGRFNLALAGHTHGGQVRLGPYAPALPPGSGRFVAGWYDVPIGRAYVSRGIGTSIAPVRLMCRPELPVFTLRRA